MTIEFELENLSVGATQRLERIRELRGWKGLTFTEEIERVIGMAWLAAEHRAAADIKKAKRK